MKQDVSDMLSITNKMEKNSGPVWVESPIKLTIGILVSNNIGTIRKCLESLKPILNTVKSELIVVDTVGEKETDGSLFIAREYTDKVFHFDWCHDFSAARNVCIDYARGEWFLYVDDDEWFEDVQEIINFFTTGECDRYAQGVYHIRNYSADGSYTPAVVSRFFRRTATTRFVGKVHETINEVYLPKKMFNVCVNHSGYIYKNKDEQNRKQKRNLGLLEVEIQEKGLNSYRAAQMVQELLSNSDTLEKGYEHCMQYISELELMGQLMKPSGQWILVASARYFAMTGKLEELFKRAELLRNKYILTQTAELALAVTVIFPAVNKDRMELVAGYAKLYFSNWDWLKSHAEEALLQSQLDFPAFCTDDYYQKIVYIAAVTANHMQDYRLANEYWKRLPWKQEGFDGTRFAKDMKITMEGLQKMQKWQQTEELLKMLCQALELLEKKMQADMIDAAMEKEKLDLLQAMQETAITIGRSVEELAGEGTELVDLLEEFCELVWKCSQITNLMEEMHLTKTMTGVLNKITLNYAGLYIKM